MQAVAWQVSLILMVIIASVFLYVFVCSGRKVDTLPSGTDRIRQGIFWLLVVIAVPVTAYSLTKLPYNVARQQDQGAMIIDAVGHQWYWTLSESRVQVDRPVIFQVTSQDVNHGFAVYDEHLRLLAQTQAMPNYVNRLSYTFTKPGIYKVLCLEYCGLAHHAMVAEIEVFE